MPRPFLQYSYMKLKKAVYSTESMTNAFVCIIFSFATGKNWNYSF